MSISLAPDHAILVPAPEVDPVPPGLACQLPADAYWHLVRTLRLTLPPPPGANPEEADVLRRDHAAIARIAALAPANAAEADVAAQFVAASEQWKECLRLAQQPDTSPQWAAKCRAKAAAMMRQANSAMRLLLRLQAARRKLEADNAACDRAAWTEHTATRLMAEALAHIRTEPPQVSAPAESAQPSEAAPREAPAEPGPDLIAAAERYAAAYPERAAQIRRTRRLPCDVRYFDPPEAALARALIAGTTPALAALDRAFPEARGFHLVSAEHLASRATRNETMMRMP